MKPKHIVICLFFVWLAGHCGAATSNTISQIKTKIATASAEVKQRGTWGLFQWLQSPDTNTAVSAVVTKVVTRDDLTVRLETVLKSIAQTYGIAATNNLAQARQIFVTKYATNTGTTAASIVARDQILDDKATFQTAYGLLQTLNVTGAAATTNIVNVTTYDHIWSTNNPAIQPQDVEEAQR